MCTSWWRETNSSRNNKVFIFVINRSLKPLSRIGQNSFTSFEGGETSANESLSQVKKSSNLSLLFLETALISTFGADIDNHKPKLILPGAHQMEPPSPLIS